MTRQGHSGPGTEVAPAPLAPRPLPTGLSPAVAITDLLDRIPLSTRQRAAPTAAAERPFSVELPSAERAEDRAAPLAEAAGAPVDAPPPTDLGAPDRAPLPSYAVALVGGLVLLALSLTAALATGDAGPAAAAPPAPDARRTAATAVGVPTAPAFGADPAPIPVDLLTRLEDASQEPLDVELSRLLDAVQHGFGRRSAVLEPTLGSYVSRMSSRFERTPDTFRVAVTAPDPDLAAARGALLERLFKDAAAAGRLQVGTGVGPHALTLVSE